MTGLEDVFKFTVSKVFNEDSAIDFLWQEIVEKYSSKKRHYHNLAHIESMLQELLAVKAHVGDWEVIIFALVYHDIIYSATGGDNEEKSASLARNRLQQGHVTEARIRQCEKLILATKGHHVSEDQDVNFFTDADLSILGKSSEEYKQYARNVRREYAMYPDFLYKPGRKKVLNNFLKMTFIFKTPHFREKYEIQARLNLEHELSGYSL
jgi:predicted metal-dependent HD superfamily phosphohydrolase